VKVLHCRNVNDAYSRGISFLRTKGEVKDSRAGKVLVAPAPVTTVYDRPWERVLFCPRRDANPLFHLFEALWLLAGRRDGHWLDLFVRDFSSRFAEDDGNLHGSYGFRWRHHFDMEGGGEERLPDQLRTVVHLLRENHDDRRVVLSMWDPVADLGVSRRDIPCNLCITPRVRTDESGIEVLDITVFCRSNDLVWGCLAGDTKIQSPEGDTAISELAARFELGLRRFPVYAIDPATGNMALKWCTRAWKTGVKPVRELVFDDGSKLRLTGDHRLYRKLIRRGVQNSPMCISEVPAADLKIGDRIWAPRLYKRGGRTIFKRNILHNTAFANSQHAHRAYDELLNGPLPQGMHVHHRDGDITNDRASNLERISRSSHMSLHMKARLAALTPEERRRWAKRGSLAAKAAFARMSEEERKAIHKRRDASASKRIAEYWKNVPPEERRVHAIKASLAARAKMTDEDYRERGRKGSASRWKDPEQRRRQSELMKRLYAEGRLRGNHKIVAIRELPPEPVYDFTVEDYHTALVGSGVLAHNCCGANAVHFSVLHEYLSASIGVGMGRYYQISNNYHAYVEILEKVGEPDQNQPYQSDVLKMAPMQSPVVAGAEQFDTELQRFMAWTELNDPTGIHQSYPHNPWLYETAAPLYVAARLWRQGERARALDIVEDPRREIAPDWHLAVSQWMRRRMDG
jgi:thymidylate synthase